MLQGLTVDEGHDKERVAVRLIDLVDRADVWMIQRCRRLPHKQYCRQRPPEQVLVLNLLSKATVGRTLVRSDGQLGYTAIICADRATWLAKGQADLEGLILGHLMAHEVGHLLGVCEHSATGVMKAGLAGEDVEGLILGSTAVASDPEVKVRVRVYDYAEVSHVPLGQAQRVASEIFQRSGVTVEWVECPAGKAPGYPRCTQAIDPAQLVLRILPKSMAKGVATSGAQFGISLLATDGSFAYIAFAFDGRVRDFARNHLVNYPVFLGLVMAHEIGHLLLGNNSHSLGGIMNAKWRACDVRRAKLRAPAFTAEQSERLREGIRARGEAGRQMLLAAREIPKNR